MAEFLGAALLTALLAVAQPAPELSVSGAVSAPDSSGRPTLAAPDTLSASTSHRDSTATLADTASGSAQVPPPGAVAPAAATAGAPVKPPSRIRYPGAPLLLTAPFFDWPHSFRDPNATLGLHSPSMRQALLWNASATQLAVQSLAYAWESNGWTGPVGDIAFWVSLGTFSWASNYVPLGGAWVHEEWHRAVLSSRGADSHNGVYDYEFGASIIKVDGVTDEDLVALKRDHPADFIRLMGAGYEAQTEAHRLMRRNNFFLGRGSHHDRFLWWVDGINSTLYLAACANGWLDEDIEAEQRGETSMMDRDFTGPDFTSWVHDLRRPSLHYADGPRGRPHPSGTPGFRRYLSSEDLSSPERGYLRLQAWLSLLNFASPQFFGPDWMPGVLPWDGQGVLWNAGMAHHLTPFGYEVAADLLLRRGKWAWIFTAQAYASADMALPGLRAELVRYPLLAGRQVLYLTGAASAWLQPDGLLFHGDEARPGGSLLGGAALPFGGGLEVWAEADAKSEGWEPGNVHLDPAIQARAGLALRL